MAVRKGRHRIAHRCVRRRWFAAVFTARRKTDGREREEKVAKIGEATKQSRARLGLHHLASRGASELTFLLLVARLGGLGVWSDEFFVFATS